MLFYDIANHLYSCFVILLPSYNQIKEYDDMKCSCMFVLERNLIQNRVCSNL